MGKSTPAVSAVTIGLDLGDRKSHIVVLSPDGKVVQEERVKTSPCALREFFGSVEPARVALEAGAQSAWISRLLKDCGHEVIVANPRQVPLIFKSYNKCDRVDAECLARLARMDLELLRPIQHRGVEAQRDLALLRSRDLLVRVRTKLLNHTRSLVKSFGERLPSCSAPAFHHKVMEAIPEGLRLALQPIVETLKDLTAKISDYDRKIEKLGEKKYPETTVLRQIS